MKDHVTTNDQKLDSVPITNKLFCSVSSGRQKYEDSLEKEKQKNRSERAENQKRIINDEIRDTKANVMICRRHVKHQTEFVSSVEKAEIDRDNVVTLIIKAHALKRRSVEAQTEVKRLDEALLILRRRERNLINKATY